MSQYYPALNKLIQLDKIPEPLKQPITNSRYWIDIDSLACLIAAMIDVSVEDLRFNGASNKRGEPNPSKTHKNGYNGDLRYLRIDESGGKLNLKAKTEDWTNNIAGWDDLDEIRQVNLIDVLYKFGWKSFVSQKYGNNNEKILSRTTEDKKFEKHFNHLHIQGFKHSSIYIK